MANCDTDLSTFTTICLHVRLIVHRALHRATMVLSVSG